MPSPMTVGKDPRTTLIASGLAELFAIDPLVAVYNDGGNSFRILIHVYVPDGCTPDLDTDFNTIEKIPTDAGELSLRLININYDRAPVNPKVFSLWKINVTYTVEGPGADALWVRLFHAHTTDPETGRGTVTSVATT